MDEGGEIPQIGFSPIPISPPMVSLLKKYARWLHTRWPAGVVEKLPVVGQDGKTNIPGVRIVGDLTGIPLLKFAAHTGARAVKAILRDPGFQAQRGKEGVLDLVIVGGGVSGFSAAVEAAKAGLDFQLFEAVEEFSTVENFPKGKPIFTYPTEMTPAGAFRFKAKVKEDLLEELVRQRMEAKVTSQRMKIDRIERAKGVILVHSENGEPIRALQVIVAIGRSGNFRKLDVPGETLDKVTNRLHDPQDFMGEKVAVVGGGDAALETAVALVCCGAQVTLSYRKNEFSRPKPENVKKVEALAADPTFPTGVEEPSSDRVNPAADFAMRGHHPPGSLRVELGSRVREIRPDSITLEKGGKKSESLPNDAVFVMTGREAPLEFFRKSGISVLGEWGLKSWSALALFFAFCVFLYHWKSWGPINGLLQHGERLPFDLLSADASSLLGSVMEAARDPGFLYSLAFSTCVVAFGFRRIRRRRTPYVRRQTLALMAFQVIPLFLLPYVFLPWMGNNGLFDAGLGKWIGDTFFPGESYWRAFGFILAWPLFVWNVFTEQPIWGWLVLSLIQTFVIIPWIVRRWGKGAYCGWVCSCGALAETLGDAHRHKMPHGVWWNRLNMVGQIVLAAALALFLLRVVGWFFPSSFAGKWFSGLADGYPVFNYKYLIDLWLAGVLGLAFYFHLSGRVWCRFACPLAALMHIYARFSRFRIFADKKKCISCNVCTSVCHQGIDIMNFANKGLPMEDPQCVRCSACVQSCPTGVLHFGRWDGKGRIVLDKLAASPVQLREDGDGSVRSFLKELNGLHP